MVYEHEINIFNEDALKNKFSTISTQFDVTLGKISAIVSDSEIEQYVDGHTTMNTRLTSTIQDLEGVHTQVSSMQTEYRDGFTQVESRLTQVDVTVNGIDARVSSVTDRVSAAEVKIEPNAIISTVMETSDGQDALVSAIEQTSERIHFAAKYLSWDSTYSSMTENGTLKASNVDLTGKITATSGYIGTAASGFNITSDAIWNGISSVGATSGTGVYIGTDGINLGGGKFKVTSSGTASLTGATISGQLTMTNNSSYCAFESLKYNAQIYLGINGGHDAFRLCDVASKDDAAGYGAYLIVDKRNTSYKVSTINRNGTNIVVNEHALVSSTYSWTRLTHYLSTYSFAFECNNYVSSTQMYYSLLKCSYSEFNVSASNYTFLVNSSGGKINGNSITTSSSRRYKHDINAMTDAEFDPHKLLNLIPKQFVYNDGQEQYKDTKGMVLPGFIAEEVEEIYPSAVIHNQKGEIESWDERRIIPGMLALIQELNQRVKKLEGKGATI